MNVDVLRTALIKDFNNLYVKEFTTDWKFQRMMRSIEINLMKLENTLNLLEKKK